MAFWITLIRGMLAVTLGLALLFWPDKARPMLVNFMGMFWLLSGIVTACAGASTASGRGACRCWLAPLGSWPAWPC